MSEKLSVIGGQLHGADAPAQKKHRFATEVKQHLLQRIMRGDIQPGRRIVELDVAAEFNVSQMAVREALNDLESQGLVDTGYYRGSRVRVIPAAEVQELYLMCASLEHLAIQMAAQQYPELGGQLRCILAKAVAAAEKKDRAGFKSLEREFREAIVLASNSRPLTEQWKRIALQVELAEQQHGTAAKLPRSQRILGKVVQALESRDGHRAGRILATCVQHPGRTNRLPKTKITLMATDHARRSA